MSPQELERRLDNPPRVMHAEVEVTEFVAGTRTDLARLGAGLRYRDT